ncbi:MAG TPA: hypothetical protein VGD61_05475 [Pyrinomonadaceae bacterium]
MSKVYMYVVDRDFGFAPNPFHGYCSLATCKPMIRKQAEVEDWVIGMGGARLKATGRCVFAMRVTEKLTFNDYWSNPRFFDKRPVRNGSQRMMVGDNIYHFNARTKKWHQADSHHSKADGSINLDNLTQDTSSNNVLVSQHFFYFGSEAPVVPRHLLNRIGYKNARGYRVFKDGEADSLINWLHNTLVGALNLVLADPFNFEMSHKRYSASDNRVT